MKNFSLLEKKIKIKFKNKDLLKQAFVHRSYLNEHPDFPLSHNERLEFLGDAVLEIVVTDYLYRHYPNPEGELTNWRASLVKAQTLSKIALELGLNNYLYLSKGEEKDPQPKARKYILANCLEALIGAIYLDRGLKTAKKFIEKYILKELPYILEHKLYLDPKTKFQEAAQEHLSITPSYKVLKEWGPAHARRFKVGVFLNKEMVASGEGTSKQEAEMEATKKALKKKGW